MAGIRHAAAYRDVPGLRTEHFWDLKERWGMGLKVLLVNGSPHKEGCTYTALCEVADTLNKKTLRQRSFGSGTSRSEAVSPV